MNKSSRINKLVECCLAMEAVSAKKGETLAYMARSIVIATLPHSKPKDNVFVRQNGDFTLTMIGNPQFGLPYGAYPRLLMAWITREAKTKQSPILQLGKSFSEFLKMLNLTRSGGVRGEATRLREQMLKLFSTHISCLSHDDKRGICKANQFIVARSFELWWSPLKENEISQQSTITLAKDFYEEIIDRAVPVDFRMLHALRRSPLQMDIYVWLTYRFSYLKKPTLIFWNSLSNQFGSNYASNRQGERDFKREFLKALRIVMMMYKEANVEIQDDGIVLKKSRTHVSKKKNNEVSEP